MATVSDAYIHSLRLYLRLNNTRLDDEITDLVEAARKELVLAGISPEKVDDESDPLIKRALAVYIKAEFGLDNDDAGSYRESFEMLKRFLALSSEYKAEG